MISILIIPQWILVWLSDLAINVVVVVKDPICHYGMQTQLCIESSTGYEHCLVTLCPPLVLFAY